MAEISKNKQSISGKIVPLILISGLLYLIAISVIVILYSLRTEKFNKEQIPFIVELRDSSSESDIFHLEQYISKSNYCVPASVHFISKEEAVNKLISDELKKEEIEVFDENLLPNIIEFQLKSNFASKEKDIISDLKKQVMVADVISNRSAFSELNANLQRIRLIASFLLIFFIFVAVMIAYRNHKQFYEKAHKPNEKSISFKGQIKQDIRNALVCGISALLVLASTLFIFNNQWQSNFYENLITLSLIAISVILLSFFLFAGTTKLISYQSNNSK